MIRNSFYLLLKLALFLLQAAVIVTVTVILAGAFAARQGPELEVWHTTNLESEFHVGQEVSSLDQYLEIEDRVFEELNAAVVEVVGESEIETLNRFSRNSRSFPEQAGINLNRSQVLRPGIVQGGVLMLHGMTDSPYSMRHFARQFQSKGFYVLNLRMPGHGTLPAGLATVDWRDWEAAVRVGAKHVASLLEPDQPFVVMGYSNGGALAVHYALNSLESTALRTPDSLVLVSPMLGVSRLARFGKIYYWLGQIGFFHKSLWLDLLPEYDPHKYNSFPMNAAIQSHALTSAIYAQVLRLSGNGELSGIPPVLTFQSLVDSTVLTRSIVDNLFDLLPDNGSELVIFDLNRDAQIASLVKPDTQQLFEDLIQPDSDQYGLTVISNESDQVRRVREYHKPANSADIATRDLGLEWPRDFYSLSHVALPFPPDDMVYGYLEPSAPSRFPGIGRAQMLGENGALAVPSSLFTRARSNPFFGYLQQRLEQAIDGKN